MCVSVIHQTMTQTTGSLTCLHDYSMPVYTHMFRLPLAHSIPGVDISVPAIMAVADQVQIYPYTASHDIEIVLIQNNSVWLTTVSYNHFLNVSANSVAPTCWQFSIGFDTHVNLSELPQNSWSEAEGVLSTAGVK